MTENTERQRCSQCGTLLPPRPPRQIGERNFCNRSCQGRYRSAHYVGTRAAHWRGGEKRDRGRVLLYRPEHPSAQSNGYVYRYRIVAEEMLGRQLMPHEIVHHIDGNESNDEPANLRVMTQAEHAALHARPALGLIPEQCGNGHALTESNLYRYTRDGLDKWGCRACRREADRRFRAKHRMESAA